MQAQAALTQDPVRASESVMGMFDYVNVKMDCPKCGNSISGFQTKDSECLCELVSAANIGNFYASCDKCKAWVEFYRRLPPGEKEKGPPLTREQVEEMGFKLQEELLDGRWPSQGKKEESK